MIIIQNTVVYTQQKNNDTDFPIDGAPSSP